MSTEQHAAKIIREVIKKAQSPDDGFLRGEQLYAKQAGTYQGTLLSIAQELEQGTPLERIMV